MWKQYQAITTIAKKVGGPINLCLIIFETGIVIGGATVLGINKIKKMIKKSKNKEIKIRANNEYENSEVVINPGDTITIGEIDEDVALIKVNDKDEPYYVSIDALNIITNCGGDH